MNAPTPLRSNPSAFMRWLHHEFKRAGLATKESRLEYSSRILGRPMTGADDLSADDMHALLAALQRPRMQDLHRTDRFYELSLTVKCPTCKAIPGEGCTIKHARGYHLTRGGKAVRKEQRDRDRVAR